MVEMKDLIQMLTGALGMVELFSLFLSVIKVEPSAP
jgi:hypothetical protein